MGTTETDTESVPAGEFESRRARDRITRILRSMKATLVLAWRAAPLQFGIVATASFVMALVSPLTLLATARFIDGIVARPPSVQDARILWPVLALGGLALLTRTISVVVDRAQVMFAERVHMLARFSFLRHLTGSDISLLEDPAWRDRLKRARGDVSWRPYSMTQTMIWVFGSTVTLTSLLGALLVLDPILLALGLLSVLPPIVMRFRINQRLYKLHWTTTRREREHDYLVNIASEPSYTKEVHAFSLGAHVVDRAQALSLHRLNEQRGIYRQANFGDALGGVVSAVVLVVSYAIISDAAILGRLSIGEVAGVLGAFAAVTGHLTALLTSMVSLDQHAPFLDDYFSFLATEPRVRAPATPRALPARIERIALRHATFAYPGTDAPALTDVDLELTRGKTIALVGENGAGKSTLVKLLLRFFDTTSGSVEVDGIDVKEVDPRALRERVGVLFQDFANYELEVREGIHFGRIAEPFAQERASRALDASRASEVLGTLDDGRKGMDAVVGRVLEGGHDLSGGQWQRLALARLIYRDADVWILDEPTANLDPEAEARVFEELRELTRDKMTIVISHRFSTVRTADEIVVLDKGRVLERGTHDALVGLGGRYAALFELQAKNYR